MFCFCLPTSPHLSVSAAVTLMSPEKRLWKIFKEVLLLFSLHELVGWWPPPRPPPPRPPPPRPLPHTCNSQEHEGNIWRAWSRVNNLQKRLPPSSLSPQGGSLFLNRIRTQKKVVGTLQKRLPPSSLSPQEGSLFLNRKRKQKKVVAPTEE